MVAGSVPHVLKGLFNRNLFVLSLIHIYPVLCSSPDEAIKTAEEFLASAGMNYDVVFFDLPGTVNSEGVINSPVSYTHLTMATRKAKLSKILWVISFPVKWFQKRLKRFQTVSVRSVSYTHLDVYKRQSNTPSST